MKAVAWHGKRDVRVDTSCRYCCATTTRSAWTPLPRTGFPLSQAPQAYASCQEKKDGTVKVLLRP